MLRRNLTSIELKLDDIMEYENVHRERVAAKEQKATKSDYNEPPAVPEPKTRQEVLARIGYESPIRMQTNQNPYYP